jgi:hypothetical protein
LADKLRELGQSAPELAPGVNREQAEVTLTEWVTPHREALKAANKALEAAVNIELDELLGAHEVSL